MANELVIDNETGEITNAPDLSTLETMVKAEIDIQVATAKRYVRPGPHVIRKNIEDYATIDMTTAEKMRYALPRGKNEDGSAKVISGPSIRFMEIVAQQYGNCWIGTRITEINTKDKYVEAEGVFVDLQTNVRQVARHRRRISDKRNNLFNADMIQTTQNAAASIARRNAITMGVPEMLWQPAYEAATKIVMGTAETLSNTRAKAVAAFTNFGLGQEQVLLLVGRERLDDVGGEDVANLRAMFVQLKAQEITVEELLRSAKGAAETKTVTHANPMADEGDAAPQKGGAKAAAEPAKPEEAATATVAAETSGTGASEPEKKPATSRKRAVAKPAEEAAPAEANEASSVQQADESSPLPEVEDGKVADAKPAAAAPTTAPTNEAEYTAYAKAWIEAGDVASDMMERWKAERALRRDCNITSETMDLLKDQLDAAVAAL